MSNDNSVKHLNLATELAPYLKKTNHSGALQFGTYLKGVSSNDFDVASEVLFGG